MDEKLFEFGDVFRENKISDPTRYRILGPDPESGDIAMIRMDVNYRLIPEFPVEEIVELLKSGAFLTEKDEAPVVDIDKLSENIREEFEKRRKMMREIAAIYNPIWLGFMGKKPKPELQAILKKYSIKPDTFNRLLTRYLQGGMADSTLVHKNALLPNRNERNGTYKAGRKPKDDVHYPGVIVDDDIRKCFDWGVREIKSGRLMTIKAAYNAMNAKFFSETTVNENGVSVKLKPPGERPTERQYRYYVAKKINPKEMDLILTSAREQRNNKRILRGDSLFEVYGPMDLVEIDICEIDLSLVSRYDKDQSVGRAILYIMVDVYTRAIVAIAVGFNNNSLLGLTSLFLNLFDDKKIFCSKYGVIIVDERLWPSGFLPRRIRVDRGSDMISKEFRRICNELGIQLETVPGAMGSMKGVVERIFGEIHSSQKPFTEGRGVIEKRYDSKHHEEATMNIDQYTKMVINYVISHNQRYMKDYPLTEDMIAEGVEPIPVKLWEYGMKKYLSPRPITTREQYLYTLMQDVDVTISRKGIGFKGFYYLPDDDCDLNLKLFETGNKKEKCKMRLDPRRIGSLYYLKDGRLKEAPMAGKRTGNSEFAEYTLAEIEAMREAKAKQDRLGKIRNEELEAGLSVTYSTIAADADKDLYSSTKNLKQNRRAEQQDHNRGNAIEERLEKPALPDDADQSDETPKVSKKYSSIADIIDAKEDLH